jgi:hypothetical protein
MATSRTREVIAKAKRQARKTGRPNWYIKVARPPSAVTLETLLANYERQQKEN